MQTFLCHDKGPKNYWNHPEPLGLVEALFNKFTYLSNHNVSLQERFTARGEKKNDDNLSLYEGVQSNSLRFISVPFGCVHKSLTSSRSACAVHTIEIDASRTKAARKQRPVSRCATAKGFRYLRNNLVVALITSRQKFCRSYRTHCTCAYKTMSERST